MTRHPPYPPHCENGLIHLHGDMASTVTVQTVLHHLPDSKDPDKLLLTLTLVTPPEHKEQGNSGKWILSARSRQVRHVPGIHEDPPSSLTRFI